MNQPGTMQRSQSIDGLDVVADLQLHLAHRPWTLLVGNKQQRKDRLPDSVCRLGRRTTTLILHGKVLPFRAGPGQFALRRGHFVCGLYTVDYRALGRQTPEHGSPLT